MRVGPGVLDRSTARTRVVPVGPVVDHSAQPKRGGRRRLVPVGVCVMTALGTVACANSSPVPGPSATAGPTTRTPSSPSSASSPATADPTAVASVYDSFWPVVTTFDRSYPEAQWKTVLGRVSVDPQLSQAIAVAKEQRRNGITLYGQPRPRTPRITINSKAKATLNDCVDFSHGGQADAKTGQRKTVGLARTSVTLIFAKGPAGWRVSTVTFPGGKC